MSDRLAEIVANTRHEVEQAKARRPLASVKRAAEQTPMPRNLFQALSKPRNTLKVSAEVNKASPSAGLIREDFDPVELARSYHEAGAHAISCLTDARYFQGSLDNLTRVKEAVPLPVLRKDFIVDPYQVYESRAAGADAVLLIAECIDSDALLLDLLILATELNLTTLLEVHDVENLLRVRPHLGFPHPSYTLLGINNRDLKTMSTDIAHTLRLLEMVEDQNLVVSEAGIGTREDVRLLQQGGVHRMLVGEHLMRQPDVGAALRSLLTSK